MPQGAIYMVCRGCLYFGRPEIKAREAMFCLFYSLPPRCIRSQRKRCIVALPRLARTKPYPIREYQQMERHRYYPFLTRLCLQPLTRVNHEKWWHRRIWGGTNSSARHRVTTTSYNALQEQPRSSSLYEWNSIFYPKLSHSAYFLLI